MVCLGCAGGGLPRNFAVPPALVVFPEKQVAALGGTATFSILVAGFPTPTINCSASRGSVSIAEITLTYTAPSQPPLGSVTISCTARNEAGSSPPGEITVDLQWPVPVVAAVTPERIFCRSECVQAITVKGSGFYEGGAVTVRLPGTSLTRTVTVPAGTNGAEFTVSQSFDEGAGASEGSYSPGWVEVSVASPPGPGGGTSNSARVAFLGSENTLELSDTHAFQLDQGRGEIHRFRLSDEVLEGSFTVGRLTYDHDVDPVAGIVVTSHDDHAVDTWNLDGTPAAISRFTNDHLPLAVAAGGGHACFTRDLSDEVATFPLDQGMVLSLSVAAIGDQPHPVRVSHLGADPVCVGFNREDLVLWAIRLPDMNLLHFTTLVGLTQASKLAGTGRGGWALVTFATGPAAGKAVVLAAADTILAGAALNFSPAQELPRIQLPDAVRIWADDALGVVWVANVDGTVDKVDVATLTVSRHASRFAVDLLPVGFAGNASALIGCMRNRCQFLPKQ